MSKIRDDSIVPIRKRQIQQLLQPLPSPKSRRTSSLSSITSNKNATSVAAATTTTSSPSVPLFPAILGDAAGGTVGSLPTNEHLLHSSSLLPRSTVRRQSAEAKLLELAACLERCAQLLSSLMVDNSIAHAGSAAITTTTPTVTATDSGPDMSSLPNAAILISNAEGVVSEDALVFAKATATSPTPTPTTKKGFQFPVSSAPNSFSVLPPQQQQLLKLHVESFRKMSTVFSIYNTSAPTSRKPSLNTNDSHSNSNCVPTTGEVEEEVASLAPPHELPPTAVEAQHQHYLLHHQHLLQLQQLLGLPEQQPLSRLSPRASVFCPDEELATSNDGGDEREKTTTTTTVNNSDKINDSQRTQWGSECQQDMAVFDDIGTGIALSGGTFANSVMMMMMDPAMNHSGLPVLSEDEDADVVVGDKSQASQLDDDSLHPPPMPLHPSSPEQEKPSVFQRLRRNSSKTNLSLDGIEKLFQMVQAANAFLTEEFLSRLDPSSETISKSLATTMMATTTSSSASPSPTHQRLRTPSGTSYFALFPTSTMGGGGVHESSSSASPTQPKAPLLPNQHQGSGSGAHSPIRLSARPSIAEFATSATALANLCKASTSSIFAFPPPPSAQQHHHVPPTNHVVHHSSANASGTGGAALNAYSGRSPPHLFLFSPLAHNVTTSTSSREQSSDTQSVKQVSLQVTTTTLTKSNDELTGNKIINQYLILNDIGEGACGKVKLAYSLERNITVAIKVVRRAVGGVVSGKGRALGRRGSLKEDAVRHEVELMKRLRHPNLVSLFEMIDDPNAEKLYLVMRFADKGSVGAMREDLTCDAMPLRALVDMAFQVCCGLQYLHERGIYHRDIKPENILQTSDGQYMIGDFGISVARRRRSSNVSLARMFEDNQPAGIGTPLFMAPELLRPPEDGEDDIQLPFSDNRGLPPADMWAFGVTLMSLALGKWPFRNHHAVKESPRVEAELAAKHFQMCMEHLSCDSAECTSARIEWARIASELLSTDILLRPTACTMRIISKKLLQAALCDDCSGQSMQDLSRVASEITALEHHRSLLLGNGVSSSATLCFTMPMESVKRKPPGDSPSEPTDDDAPSALTSYEQGSGDQSSAPPPTGRKSREPSLLLREPSAVNSTAVTLRARPPPAPQQYATPVRPWLGGGVTFTIEREVAS